VEVQNSKISLTPQIVAQIHDLKNAIETANANGDYDTFFTLYEQLYSIVVSLDDFSISTDENGLQIIEYNDKNYHFPYDQLKQDRLMSENLVNSISEAYPQFLTLPYDIQKEIIISSIYLNIEQNLSKDASHDCRSAAQRELAIRLTAYTVGYTLAAGLCGGTTILIFVCEGLAFAAYIDNCASAIKTYKTTIANC